VDDLRRLRYFAAVAEELSFSRAAERLHMAQPPLSYHVRELESELGTKLLDRNRRRVRLTEAGAALLEEAHRLLAQAERTADTVRRVGKGEVGRVSFGFAASASNDVLPPFLLAFGRRYPGIRLTLQEMNPDQQVAALHERTIDVGLLYLPFADGALESRVVRRAPLVAALPEGHPLAGEPQLAVGALSDEPFVLPPRYRVHGLYHLITETCRRAGFVPRAVQEAWLMQTLVGLVAGGMGVALVPASLQNLQRTGVVYKELQGPTPEVEMGLVWRRDDASPVLKSFLEVAEVVFRPAEAVLDP
jgi:DNA-binding transcriptional LysR family regulator